MIAQLKKINKLTWSLLIFHLLVGALAYYYTITHGADAYFYWFKIEGEVNSWTGIFGFNNGFIRFLNYPFAVILGLPMWFGFLVYTLVGFFGILQFVKLTYSLLGKTLYLHKWNVLPLLFFLPNLHFWTANLGKETLCFWWIATIFFKLNQKRYRSLGLWLSFLALFILRPHVALMLVFPLITIYLIYANWSLTKKVLLAIGGVLVCFGAYVAFLILAKVNSFDWARLQKFNAYSILSFKRADSYVPMLDYGYPMKLFSFYFRPFFAVTYNFYLWLLSFQDLVVLILHFLGIGGTLVHFKKIKLPMVSKAILLYALFAGVLYVQRYAALGIFVRTKVMIQPFVLIVLLQLVKQAFTKQRPKLT